MEPAITGLLVFAVVLVAIGVGIPVAISVGATAFFGMWILIDLNFALGMFRTLPYAFASRYEFVVVPMFVLMGALVARAGYTSELYGAAYRWFGGVRGSLFYATTVASAAFAAISSSTVVASAVFTRIALPDMIKLGFRPGISAACICAAGTFAALIPPSLSLVIYGLLTGQSVGKLFMAGIIPGLLTALVYVVGLRAFLLFRPEWAPIEVKQFTIAEKLRSVKGIWAVLVLAVVVLGGIYAGVMPPSTAGTVGAAGALVIGLVGRRLTGTDVLSAFIEAVTVASMLALIVISGLLLSRLVVAINFVSDIIEYIEYFSLTPTHILLSVIVMYLVLGMFIDTVSMMIMTLPFIFPLVVSAGFDPIWFGIVMIKLVEIGAITPPIGLNLFAVQGAAEGQVAPRDLYLSVLPFIGLDLLVLLLLVSLPGLALWLPSAMLK